MSICTDSKLFVGAYFDEINIDESELNELIYNEEIEHISPYYDSPYKHGYFGRVVTCEFVMTDGGVEQIKEMIKEMNELFKTDKCYLIHSPYVY